MMKLADGAIVKIPILKYDGRQNLDFTAWRKSFATSTGQKYGELAQVYRTGEALEYDIPSKPTISGDEDTDAMERTMYMERMADYRKAKATQNSINIQLYSELYIKLHEDSCKKLLDDPLWGKVEMKQDPKGLMIAVNLAILVRKRASLHPPSTNDMQCTTSKREGKPTKLLLQDIEIAGYSGLSRTQARFRYRPSHGLHVQARQEAFPNHDHEHV